MGTKLIVYVLMFDIILALMVGAYSGISTPSIPSMPTQSLAQLIASSVVWTVGIPQFTLIPKFTLIPSFSILGANFPGLTIPAVVIPQITFFSINFGFLWIFIYIGLLLAWIFSVLGSIIGWVLSVFTSSIGLLASVPVIGPFLTTLVLLVNFVLVWEIVKLIRGYGP